MQPRNLKVIVESHIPFIKGVIEPYAEVVYLNPDEFNKDTVADADAMIIRTRTRCDANLLQNSKVQFIATATIGTDHIDLDWCKEHGITVANAPGCNAPAVAQYVLSVVRHLSDRQLQDYTIGIIGVGHVGSIIEDWSKKLGMNVMVNDPPRQAAEGGSHWSTIDEITANADIITIHTPLDPSTHHLINHEFISRLRHPAIIINAARGPIVDTQALILAVKEGRVKHAVIDCWENEPNISPTLLQLSSIATPHIAGYSHEGKIRATRMALDALSAHFSLPEIPMPETAPATAAEIVTAETIADSYDPFIDTQALKASPSDFESLRNHYSLRREVTDAKA